jgi:hypothetical protein
MVREALQWSTSESTPRPLAGTVWAPGIRVYAYMENEEAV